MAGNVNSPPSPEIVEISIFGPGIGECILIHLTGDEWMIVDSCLDRGSHLPIALQYLNGLGVNPATNVKLFVITHWHDDHISGASQVLAACQNARFVCSDALHGKEFIKFVKLYTQRGFLEDTGVDEFDRIFQVLKERSAEKKSWLSEPGWAVADRRLLYLPCEGRIAGTEVFALSPSDAAITLSRREIADQLTPKPKTPKRRAIAQEPNHVAVVLWVTIGNFHVLLGSDLENYGDDLLGWKAILLSPTRPQGRALTVKIPHHGSSNAYCVEMWQGMVGLDNPTYGTLYTSGIAYDTGMKIVSDLQKQGKITDANRVIINQYANAFYLSYHSAVDAFATYLATGTETDLQKVTLALNVMASTWTNFANAVNKITPNTLSSALPK